VTTPIYYVNDRLHLGHAYTTIAADIFSRYYKLLGYDVFFLTGTDEHGGKVQQAAEKAGLKPKQFIDNLVIGIKDMWNLLDISYDHFIRTTDKKHVKAIQNIAKRMYDNGDIYFGEYEGWYCKGCEAYFTDKEVSENKCPYGHEVNREKEEAYFFKLSKYQDWLKNYITEHPEFLQPTSRRQEIISFIDQGLQDICISRKNVSWGIKLPFDKNYTMYVWLDALFNYLTALGYPNGKKFKRYWSPVLQLMAKDIYRFHTIYWPIFLKSIDLDIPKSEFSHGWWTVEGVKMSKSFGNMIYPELIVNEFGLDAFRYYLFKEMSFGEDGSFSRKTFIDRINNELVAGIGNLLSRVITLAEKRNTDTGYRYFRDRSFIKPIEEKITQINGYYESRELTKVVNEIFSIAILSNKYVQDNKPWELIESDPEKFDQVMYNLLEVLRILAVELSPIMTKKWKEIFAQLGLNPDDKKNQKLKFTKAMEGKIVKKGNYLFTKIDDKEKK